ncbi:MAG: PTS sugar transporter subunit IIA [Gammaproteobacteria bacterium]|nr:PTS sugar transporter subunit IIA [Gammaproteobacteria bacterium]NNF49627.1 PTS transporter subunit EIIA [Woeseiaceae bacterium]MBT8095123.1 PTS sugar transporter subunit IIA [Gammaproteobacteria bacterium]MBT8104603.1 PTS sugar transporter subunit IIA [Gammaproteobacteria bacterium]NNK24617.1 PTS transporter subunit EIIA [Woeseiaceae bacterium]
MLLQEIIKPDGVLCNAMARSKKHCLEILSELLARRFPDVPSDDVFEALVERERLGCTSLNKGAAFPHCRVKGIDISTAVLIKLSEPVDFDSPDGEPVDIVFGMMLPTNIDEDDKTDIRCVTAVLGDEALRARLRAMNSSKDLYEALISGAEMAWQANCA